MESYHRSAKIILFLLFSRFLDFVLLINFFEREIQYRAMTLILSSLEHLLDYKIYIHKYYVL